MIENYRSGLIWDLLMKNKHAQKGLERAGIHAPELPEGFVGATTDSKTGCVDLIQHPDRKVYEIDYSLDKAGSVEFSIRKADSDETVKEFKANAQAGISTLAFDHENITRGETYLLTMTSPAGKTHEIKVILH